MEAAILYFRQHDIFKIQFLFSYPDIVTMTYVVGITVGILYWV
jgi:hypothetical protein